MHGKTLDLVRVVAVASEEGEERASAGGRRWWCLRLITTISNSDESQKTRKNVNESSNF
jgi:hypothetical protein